MGKTTFRGPVRVGLDTGIPSTTTIGRLVAEQACTVTSTTSGAQNLVLPSGSRISDMFVDLWTAASTNTQGVNVRVGNSGQVDAYATIKTSAASSRYRLGDLMNVAAASAKALHNIGTADVQIYVDVTGVTTAVTTDYEGLLVVQYIPGE